MPIERLPERARPPARKFRDWFATDSGLVAILAVMFVLRSFSYGVDSPGLLQHVFEVAPHWAAPSLWGSGGALLALSLHPRMARWQSYALAYAVALLTLWGVLYLWSTPPAFFGRGVVYISLSLMSVYTVWRGQSKTMRLEAERGRA